jgi:hypothetical protein
LREVSQLDRISFEKRERALAPAADHKQLAMHLADEMVRFAEDARSPRAMMTPAASSYRAS